MDTQLDPRLIEIATLLAEVTPNNSSGREARLEEDLDLANRQIQMLRLEDQGWQLLQGNPGIGEGVSLIQLKEMSQLLQPAVAGSPLPKQANNLRASYTFSEPFIIPGIEQSGDSGSTDVKKNKVGAPSATDLSLRRLKAFVNKRTSRDYVFGKQAQELVSTACSTDGIYLLLGDSITKELHPIPLNQITALMENPEFPGETWAYQREWNMGTVEKPDVRRMWVYTDRYEGTRAKTLGLDKTPVSLSGTMFDLVVNSQTGWALGIPDLWAGHVWNRYYLQAMMDGIQVTDLLAWLSAKIKKQSKAGSDAVGVKVGAGGPAGSMQTYGQGNSIDTYATTGKAYDFDALRGIAAIYALAAGVSTADLLAGAASAGASYSSAQALAPGMRRAIAVRRDIIASFRERIIEWAVGDFYQVTAANIEEETPYRTMQMLQLGHMTGLYWEDELRPAMAGLMGIALKHQSAPPGYLPPNNKNSLARKDIDTDGTPAATAPASATPAPATPGQTKTAPSANQGKSAGTGGTSSTGRNDTRTDVLAPK